MTHGNKKNINTNASKIQKYTNIDTTSPIHYENYTKNPLTINYHNNNHSSLDIYNPILNNISDITYQQLQYPSLKNQKPKHSTSKKQEPKKQEPKKISPKKTSPKKISPKKISLNENKPPNKYVQLYKSQIICNNMTILVIMSTYNRSNLVIKAIESVINQTYTNWLLHIVDDSSTDDSINVIVEYLNNSKPKNVIFSKNSYNVGTYINKNYVLHYHSKNIIGFWTSQDSDDISLPSRFEKCINCISNNNLMAVNCLCSRKGIINRTRYSEGIIIYKRQVLNDIGYYDTNRFGCDKDYYNRFILFYTIDKIIFVDDILYEANSDYDSLTVKYDASDRKIYLNKSKIENIKSLFRNYQSQ